MAIGIKYSSALKDFDPGKYIRDFWDDYAKEWNKQQEVIEKNKEQSAGLKKYNFGISNSNKTKALYDEMNTANDNAADALLDKGLMDPEAREAVRQARLTTIANVTEIGNRVNAYNKAMERRNSVMYADPTAVYKKQNIGYDDFANGMSADDYVSGNQLAAQTQNIFDAFDNTYKKIQNQHTNSVVEDIINDGEDDEENPVSSHVYGRQTSTTTSSTHEGAPNSVKQNMLNRALNLNMTIDYKDLNETEQQLRDLYMKYDSWDPAQKKTLQNYMYLGYLNSITPDVVSTNTSVSDLKSANGGGGNNVDFGYTTSENSNFPEPAKRYLSSNDLESLGWEKSLKGTENDQKQKKVTISDKQYYEWFKPRGYGLGYEYYYQPVDSTKSEAVNVENQQKPNFQVKVMNSKEGSNVSEKIIIYNDHYYTVKEAVEKDIANEEQINEAPVDTINFKEDLVDIFYHSK